MVDDLIPFSVPLVMLLFTPAHFTIILKLWLSIVMSASFIFGVIGLNAAHHHNETIHDGDYLG
jgi:hypothetical protein